MSLRTTGPKPNRRKQKMTKQQTAAAKTDT